MYLDSANKLKIIKNPLERRGFQDFLIRFKITLKLFISDEM